MTNGKRARGPLASSAKLLLLGVSACLSPDAFAQTASAPGTVPNPFAGARPFVTPQYRASITESAARVPELADRISPLASVGTGIWITAIRHVQFVGMMLDEAEAQASSSGEPVVATFVLYNLPERDCAASASAGELTIDNDGVRRYRSDFIDPVAASIRNHPGIRVVIILEPDSLPNLATNMNIPRCARAASTYIDSTAYAIQALSLPNATIYLDAAHGGWLGWDGNRRRTAEVFRDVLTQAGAGVRVRGFAINVSNYSPLRAADPDPLDNSYYQWNPAHDELTYARLLQQDLAAVGVAPRDIVIDTGRNGNPLARSSWSAWCNVRAAGLGERPRANPEPGIDAYLWVKPPGESDGSSSDWGCSGPDNFPSAPQAGQWFFDHFLEMARRANPSL